MEWNNSALITGDVAEYVATRAGDIGRGSFALDEPTEAEIERRRRLADGSPVRRSWASRM